MFRFLTGNLLEADAEAIVNTVNTVGVMGKGIALMFKDRFPENFKAYSSACREGEIRIGEVFVTTLSEIGGPKWIINFPTKKHWRNPTQLEWVQKGLVSLKAWIREHEAQSIAIPPLGCGNGGLDWSVVRPLIESELADLSDVEIQIFEPTSKYQNISKKTGVTKLTIPRAMIAEMVRRYEISMLDCSFLEIQKMAWFLERETQWRQLKNVLDFRFIANRYGPYSNRLEQLLNQMDGSYIHSDKRVTDATPFDTIRFDYSYKDEIQQFLKDAPNCPYLDVVEEVHKLIDGFQTPDSLEALATVDWLMTQQDILPNLESIKRAIHNWPSGKQHAERKEQLFDDRLLEMVIERLVQRE